MSAITALTPARKLSDMPGHARVWLYKTARDISQAEQKVIHELGAAFADSWAAHGAALDACVDVLLDRFVVVAVDQEQALASGCSIDKSVGFIKELEFQLNLTLTDRMVVVHEHAGRITSCRAQELPALLAEGVLTSESMVYDDAVATVDDLRHRFRRPLRETWMQRYL
jgi:hypothetical protein